MAVEPEKKQQQHWIYVLGGADLNAKASRWAERKTRQGKSYAAIEGAPPPNHAARLGEVKSDDVLYVFADAVRDGHLGEWRLSVAGLAGLLRSEGLDHGHRDLKIFASHSGDAHGSPCFAEQLYEALRADYPRIVVFGYLGQADAEGFDGHKTAGLAEHDSLNDMGREEWIKKKARAKDNRVQFPPAASVAS